jgi:hypothetical protein
MLKEVCEDYRHTIDINRAPEEVRIEYLKLKNNKLTELLEYQVAIENLRIENVADAPIRIERFKEKKSRENE